ncbi:MAG TPA: alpha/beta hydrolase [Verrucomicrobiae bacterium]|nr:alpha/beta hydrolase [Verrucomicrobiae bacterium]
MKLKFVRVNPRLLAAAALVAIGCAAGVAREPAPDASLRTNLLVFHDRGGALEPVRSKADWEKRRKEILAAMQSIMGPLPGREKRCALDVQIEKTEDHGGYIQKQVTFASEPGSRVPAFLLIPRQALEGKQKFPAVLALHPTDAEYGYRVVVEELRPAYRAYARDLAERGYVVLAPSYPLLANYQPDVRALGYQSGTMKAIWDNIRGLDLLDSLPFVRKHDFVAIGHSLGGHNAIYTAIFDKRIRMVVSSCGFDSFRDYQHGNITGWTSERYMPALARYKGDTANIPFDFYELIAALAPRRVFINAPLRDRNFNHESVDRIVRAAEPIFRLEGAPQNLTVVHPDCEHDFPPEIREAAYKAIDEVMRPAARLKQ